MGLACSVGGLSGTLVLAPLIGFKLQHQEKFLDGIERIGLDCSQIVALLLHDHDNPITIWVRRNENWQALEHQDRGML